MVTGIMEKVAVQDMHPYTEREAPEAKVSLSKPGAEAVPVEVVSKDFILGLLSLAVGRPMVLEGNLGTNVDVKI
jgi:hypothetical protein